MARVPAAQRRQQFLDATIDVVAKHGVRGATTREIANEAQAPLAALHYCFESKDQVLFEVYQMQLRSLVDRLPEGDTKAGMAATAVDIIQKAVERCIRHRNWSLANAELEFWAQRHGDETVDGTNSYEIYNRKVEETLRAACKKGDDPSLAEPLSGLISVLVDGLNFQWFVYQDEQRLRADLATAIGMIETYVAARRTPARKARVPAR
jgi:AcrR family transcriptional regulator